MDEGSIVGSGQQKSALKIKAYAFKLSKSGQCICVFYSGYLKLLGCRQVSGSVDLTRFGVLPRVYNEGGGSEGKGIENICKGVI